MPPELDEAKQAKALRQALPYLRESGWIESRLTRSSVDADAQPIPWYRYTAIDFLQERACADQRIFEFGSGNSTLWWARRAKSVTAVEHDPGWAAKVREGIPENATLLEVPLEPDGEYCRTPQRTESLYEIIVIDGRDRVNCALQCLGSLTDDGVIVWDDSQRRRYRRGLDFLAEHGFRRLRFTGLGPIAPNNGETSVLYRPSNCFDI
jgi:Methyltransferase domain